MTSGSTFLLLASVSAIFVSAPALACSQPASVCARKTPGSAALIANGRAATVVIDPGADTAVQDAARGFAGDLAKVAGTTPGEVATAVPKSGPVVVIGVIGQSPLVDGLIRRGKINASGVTGRWEAYTQAVVANPFPGIAQALVIVGADRRGAVFGTYDLSEKVGVSPWSWWADVPVRRQTTVNVTAGQHNDAPKVKYRGIFINDEEPSFGTWARRKFGAVNSKVYTHVYDLILRLKGNYLWPAMWGKAIGVDDPLSMPLADAKGLVLGTSHHEPMTRAQSEWHRDTDDGVTGGKWDYAVNSANLRAFWRGGIERMVNAGSRGRPMEQLVTVGMRGDGDEPMAEGTAIGLLERIVTDQRGIIADVTKRPASETPQVWALYKEVQDYYDKGMKVPGDVTLLFADDNWGQVRRLPTGDLNRPGGYGVYYHFDYVGGPRSYKWLNTTQIEKTWQQMDLSYRRGAKSLWVVNVGDLKPMEVPIDFFLKMAWNPEAMTPQAMAHWQRGWATRTFGARQGAEIGDILSDYAQLAARRKSEFVDADAFQLGEVKADTLDGGDFGTMVGAWEALQARMEAARSKLPSDQHDAFFQLVEYPVAAMTNLHRLYYAVAWNRRLAAANDPRANVFADRAEAAFRHDKMLVDAYHQLGGGKWDGMMLQTKFGFTSWQDPKKDIMPDVKRIAASAGAAPRIVFAPAQPVALPNVAAVEAVNVSRTVAGKGLAWQAIPRLGRTAGAIAALPQGRPATTAADNVRAEYDLTLGRGGDATLRLYMIHTLDTVGRDGMKIGVSVDDSPVQTLTMNLKVDGREWGQAVRDYAFPLEAKVGNLAPGRHTVKLWRMDDNMLVQKLALYTGTLPQTYLGPAAAR